MDSRKSRPTQADNPTYCALAPGQHVVCIDDVFLQKTDAVAGVRYPTKGKVYTVRTVLPSIIRPGTFTVLLDELRNPKLRYRTADGRIIAEKRFAADRFRPLSRLKVEDFMSASAWWRKDKRVLA